MALSTINKMPAYMHHKADQIIRSWDYCNLNKILDEFTSVGIEGISKSSLHRYIKKMRKRDLSIKNISGTLVVLVDMATGEAVTIKSLRPRGELLIALSEPK